MYECRNIPLGIPTIPTMGRLEFNMSEARTFDEKLNSCRDIEELEGFANRRRFNPALPKWSEDERRKIIFRKAEMINKRKKK